MGALLKEEPQRYFTYTDYKEWELKEGERYELIHGEPFAMAGPNIRHQAISMEITNQLYNYLKGKTCRAFAAPCDVRLFYEEDGSDDTVVQPDIMVVCDKSKIGAEGIRGAPDLVIEILSPSNTAIEMGRKFRLYQNAGVREYWVVSPEDKALETYLYDGNVIHFRSYTATDKASVGIFPGFAIDLEPVFAEEDSDSP
ncbi:MAG: Uma2 family endonuclease [Treponema sp.]|nr:Uma2 family endonuclease [Treponema sp.]